MKKLFLIALILTFFIISGCSFIQSKAPASSNSSSTPNLNEPLLVTSFGQSIDYLILEGILDNLEIGYDSLPTANIDQVSGYSTILMVVGTSKKGLSFSNTQLEDEIKRMSQFSELPDNDPTILLFHMGGTARRGEVSDILIENSLPLANGIIVVSDGNHDSLFSNYADENNLWINEPESMKDLQELLDTLTDE